MGHSLEIFEAGLYLLTILVVTASIPIYSPRNHCFGGMVYYTMYIPTGIGSSAEFLLTRYTFCSPENVSISGWWCGPRVFTAAPVLYIIIICRDSHLLSVTIPGCWCLSARFPFIVALLAYPWPGGTESLGRRARELLGNKVVLC